MKKIFFFLIISAFMSISVLSMKCDYSYVEASSLTTNSTCAEFSPSTPTQALNIVKLKPCDDKEKFCDIDFNRAKIAETRYCTYYSDNIRKVAGEACRHDLDCYSQDCVSSVCLGRGLNQTCSHHEQCDVGLACRLKDYITFEGKTQQDKNNYEKVCLKQIDNHHSPCETDLDCANDMGCNRGVCIQYFSLENGEPSSSSILCKSGYSHTDGACRNITLMPEEGKSTANFECLGENVACKYKFVGDDDKKTFQLPCECSLSAEPKTGFCPRDTINTKFQNYTQDMQNTIVNNVHTMRRVDYKKIPTSSYWPKFEGSVKNVTTAFTYKGNSASNIKMAFSALALAFLILA